MGIDRAKLATQIESLEAQRRQHEADIHAINGAMSLCQAWLKELDEKEREGRGEGPMPPVKRITVEPQGTPDEACPVSAEANGAAAGD